MILTITKNDYLTIKALFNAASKDKSRLCLTKVFYDHGKKLLLATDGRIFRCEKPESDFTESHFFSKEEFLKNEKMLKDTEMVQTCDASELSPYPDMSSTIPNKGTIGELGDLKIIALNLNLLKQLDASIIHKAKTGKNIAFGFTTIMGAVLCYGHALEGECVVEKFYGVIMPRKIFNNRVYDSVSLPTLKNLIVMGQAGQHDRAEKESEEKAIKVF